MIKLLLLVCISSVLLVGQTSGASLGSARVKREMTPQGFYGDTFSDGFGGFRTMKKRKNEDDLKVTMKISFRIHFDIRKYTFLELPEIPG